MQSSTLRKLVSAGRYEEARALLRVAKRDWRQTVSWDNLTPEFDRVFDHEDSVGQTVWSDILDTLDDLREGKRQTLRHYHDINMRQRGYSQDQLVTILYAIREGFGVRNKDVARKVLAPLIAEWPTNIPMPPLMDDLLVEGLKKAPGIYIGLVGEQGAKLQRILDEGYGVLKEVRALGSRAKWEKLISAFFPAVYEVTYQIKAVDPFKALPDVFESLKQMGTIKEVETYIILVVSTSSSARGDIFFQDIGVTFKGKNDKGAWIDFVYYTGPAVTWVAGASEHDLGYGGIIREAIEVAGYPDGRDGSTDAAKKALRSVEMRRLLQRKTDTLTLKQTKAPKVTPGVPFMGESPWDAESLRKEIEDYGLRVTEDIIADFGWPRS
jgi:hypothetical protein